MPGLLRAFVGELWNRVTREGDIQKVQSTLDKWLTMDPKSKEILVNDAGLVKDLDSLFLSLKRLTHEVNTSGSGYIIALNKMKGDLLKGMGLVGGGALGFGGHGAAGATVGAGAGIMAGVGIETLANKAMARLLFDPKFTRLLTEGIKFLYGQAGEAGGGRIGAHGSQSATIRRTTRRSSNRRRTGAAGWTRRWDTQKAERWPQGGIYNTLSGADARGDRPQLSAFER
jgi:hypothetical protein